MNHEIVIQPTILDRMRAHLFQNELEQAAFLFVSTEKTADSLRFLVDDCYLVPASGWDVQMDVYLEMSDEERAKILKLARDRNSTVIDCHSHPRAGDNVWFSPSDRSGITEFAQYARWKLSGKPFAALVWGETSFDGVVWQGEFIRPEPVGFLTIQGMPPCKLRPTGSWFTPPRPIRINRFSSYE